MKKFCLVFLAMGMLFYSVVQSEETKKKVTSFTLEDYNGAKHSLKDFTSSKVIVLMFIATQCPISNSYNGRMVDLQKDYAKKSVQFVGINSNKQESVEEVKNHAKEHGFAFTILKDYNNVVADQVGASVTPEIFVLNSNLEILYHGRIDDSSREAKVSSKDLRAALDQILAGKAVEIQETKAFGCTIKRIK